MGLKFLAGYFPGVKTIHAVDPLTVRVELEKPDADFLATTTSGFNKVIAREAVAVA